MSAAEIQRLAKFFGDYFAVFFSMAGKRGKLTTYPVTHL